VTRLSHTPRIGRARRLAAALALCATAAWAGACDSGEDASVASDPVAGHPARESARSHLRESGLPVLGTAVEWRLLRRPGTYRRLFLRHYSSLTPENAMKMDALAPEPGRLAFGEADALVRFARRHGVAVHGHALVWGKQLPGWVTARAWTAAELRSYLEGYISSVVGRYRGRVGSWDVVNEPLAPDGSLRRNLWARVLGPGYIADALRFAHDADPGARLYVNDFNIEGRSRKTDGMVALLERLRRRGLPLDGVGLQTHLTGSWRHSRAELRRTMHRYAALGLAVDISEMDVAIGPGRAALARQARVYRTVASACRDLGACERFTTWGFTDASTWLGGSARPLPFSATGAAKPAWRAIAGELVR
jgi:endo-1,4-beta-xylanase